MQIPLPLCWARVGAVVERNSVPPPPGKALRVSVSWGQEEAGREREKSETCWSWKEKVC